MNGDIDFFPTGDNKITPLRKVCPNILASRSDRRNPWISSKNPCCTITKTRYDKIFKVSKNRTRCATIEEVKKICSFPDSWILTGSLDMQWARLGNAVMPRFMQAIAECIRDNILNRAIA